MNQISKSVVLEPPSEFAQNLQISIPGSKSYSNRALVLAGIAMNPIEISGFLFADDTNWGLFNLAQMGFSISCEKKAQTVFISPPFWPHFSIASPIQLFCGKAGTLARFFPAVALSFPIPKTLFYLDGEPQLQKRPLEPLCVALNQLGAKIPQYSLPLQISPQNLEGSCDIDGHVSGQFLSGLLMASVKTKNRILIQRRQNLVQPGYVKMTLQSLEDFGFQVTSDHALERFQIERHIPNPCFQYSIEADASTCGYFIALAFLLDFSLKINNIGSKSSQPDIELIPILRKMGALIELYPNSILIYKRNSRQIQGGFSISMNSCSDQALTVGALALFANQPIEITGIGHIKKHESNRINGFVKNCESLGIECQEKEDGFCVFPSPKENFQSKKILWKTWEDHRFAMAGAIVASCCKHVSIENPSVVEKTCPHFFEMLEQLGYKLNLIV